MKFRTSYDKPQRVKQHIGDRVLVQQHLRDETDINNIMRKYEKTGILTHVNQYAGQYGDFSGIPDYQTGLNRIRESQEMFMSLPASIRDKFNNDPGKFIEFATDKENLAEMQKMGLAPIPPSVEERPTLGAEEGGKPPKADPKPKADQ